MLTPLAEMMQRNNPVMLRHAGEDATYISADGEETSFSCLVTGRAEQLAQSDNWEVSARQIEVFAEAADVPSEFTARQDVIEVRGYQWTVLERQTTQGSQYRFLCERSELEQISHRGRIF